MKVSSFARHLNLPYLLLLIAVLVAGALLRRSALSADNHAPYAGYVRSMETEALAIAHPAGLAFSPAANTFYVLEALPSGAGTGIKTLTPVETSAGTIYLDTVVDGPINVAFDSYANRLLLYQTGASTLLAVPTGDGGELDSAAVTIFEAGDLGIDDPQGMAVDPAGGVLYLLDRGGSRLVQVAFAPDGGLDGARISTVALQQAGLPALRGLAFYPGRDHLFATDPAARQLYEFTTAGQPVATRNLAGFNPHRPQGMVFAPSGDQTDDPDVLSLYLADSGPEPERAGTIMELTLAESAPLATTAELTLVQTIDAWRWSPPSPDSAGVAFIEHAGTLMVADSEVNEMPDYFTGDNLFEATLLGDLVSTFTTINFSDEPTGVAYNPLNRHLFISDDTGPPAVYELNPGADRQYNTADDIVTSIVTSDFGSNDPEGVTYDPAGGILYVVDGVNREVYRVDPGPNGIFDGVTPAGDDQVTHFDTLALGVDDPEGIAFNSSNGNLFIVGANDVLAEVTTAGVLVQSFGISAASPDKPAGLAYAPSSLDPSIRSIYLADRGVDNGDDPDENDGRIYEFALPGSGSQATNTPEPAPTNTPTSTPAGTATGIPAGASPDTIYLPLAIALGPAPTATATPGSTPTGTPTSTPAPAATQVPITLTGIEPDSGTVRSTVAVTITGSGFRSGASVLLQNGDGPTPEITGVEVGDESTITALVTIKDGGPPRERVWDLRVTNPDGGTAVLPDAFTVLP